MNHAYYKRQFLNTEDHGGMACIEAKVYACEGKNVEATISISDCNRTVDLDFGAWGTDSIPNNLGKIRKLINTLKAFETALRAEYNGITDEDS